MKRKVIIFVAVLAGFWLQYGFLAGIGGGVSSVLVLACMAVWSSSFLRKEDGYLVALFSGIFSELISPYRFGTMIVGFLLAFLAADFLSKKVFANRMLHSYLLGSFLGILLYFLTLFFSNFLSTFFAAGSSLVPFDFTILDLRRALFWNTITLLLAFFVTNAVTKKMHAAFLAR